MPWPVRTKIALAMAGRDGRHARLSDAAGRRGGVEELDVQCARRVRHPHQSIRIEVRLVRDARLHRRAADELLDEHRVVLVLQRIVPLVEQDVEVDIPRLSPTAQTSSARATHRSSDRQYGAAMAHASRRSRCRRAMSRRGSRGATLVRSQWSFATVSCPAQPCRCPQVPRPPTAVRRFPDRRRKRRRALRRYPSRSMPPSTG